MMDDTRIIELIEQRDQAALGQLSEKYGENCLDEARKITGDDRAARECFYEALISLWNSGPRAAEHDGELGEYLSKNVRRRAMERAGLVVPSAAPDNAKPAAAARTAIETPAALTAPEPETAAAEPATEPAAEPRKRLNLNKYIILTACLNACVVIAALIAIAVTRPEKAAPPAMTGDGGSGNIVDVTPGPFEGGLAVLQPRVTMPETVEKLMNLQYSSGLMFEPEDEVRCIVNEVSSMVNYVNGGLCIESLTLDNYELDSMNGETAFQFRTTMTLPLAYAGGPIFGNVPVDYRGTAYLVTAGPGGGVDELICIAESLKAVPFQSIPELMAMNPHLEYYKDHIGNIDAVNKTISNYLTKQDFFGTNSSAATGHITGATLKFGTDKRNFILTQLEYEEYGDIYELNYKYDRNGEISEFYVYSYSLDSKDTVQPKPEPEIRNEGQNDENYYFNIPPASGSSVVCGFSDGVLTEIELIWGNAGDGTPREESRIASASYADHDESGRYAAYDGGATIRKFNASGVFLLRENYKGGKKVYGEALDTADNSIFYNGSSFSGLSVFRNFERTEDGTVIENVYRCSGNDRGALVPDRCWSYDPATGKGQCTYFDAAGRVIAALPATFNDGAWAISPRPEWAEPGLYFGKFSKSVTNDVRQILSRDIWENAHNIITADPQMFTVSEDGRFSLYLVIAIRLPVPVSSSRDRSVNIQVRITGTAVRNEEYYRPMWALYPEQTEYTGLYGTTYGAMYTVYRSEHDALFMFQAGSDLSMAADQESFDEIMINYITEQVKAKNFGAVDGQWLYAYGFKTDAAPVETFLSTDMPEDDFPIYIDDD
ncbi:MAG: hypothetical protein J5584_05360 [Clostridia bacterium]|nr:hypothetical protein [Clostridia bacterium]